MMYFKWFLYLIAHVAVIIARYPLAPLAVLFFSSEDKRTLTRLRWLETIDNDLGGDSGWQTEHIRPGSDPYSFWNRTKWLWRNGGNSFNYKQLGVPEDKWFTAKYWIVQDADRLWIRDDGAWLLRGYYGPFYLFIGWSLFGAKEGRCKFTCTIKVKRKKK